MTKRRIYSDRVLTNNERQTRFRLKRNAEYARLKKMEKGLLEIIDKIEKKYGPTSPYKQPAASAADSGCEASKTEIARKAVK